MILKNEFIRIIYQASLIPIILPFILFFILFIYGYFFKVESFNWLSEVPRNVWIAFLILLALSIFTRVIISQRILNQQQDASEKLFEDLGWGDLSKDKLKKLTQDYPNSEILADLSLKGGTRQALQKDKRILLVAKVFHRVKTQATEIKGAAVVYLILPNFKSESETIYLGSFGIVLRKIFYEKLGFHAAGEIENLKIFRKSSEIQPIKNEEKILIEKALSLSKIRTSVNEPIGLQLDEAPDIEIFQNGVLIRFTGPLNPEFIQALDATDF
jgi:hypothetical protein